MPIRESFISRIQFARKSMKSAGCWFGFGVGLVAFLLSGCSKDPAMASIETDANGYYCIKCKVKLYTDRKVFLENCPKCGENGLVEVVGYVCDKDQHVTLRPKMSGPDGAAICELCGAGLKHSMVQPHAKDFEAWGATKAASP